MADESTEQAAAKAMAEAKEKQQAEAEKAAAEQAKDIAKSAAENKPPDEEEKAPPPEKKEKTTFIVYKAVKGQPYPGRYLTVTLDDLDESIVLEDGVPAEHPASIAKAAVALESPSYTIESA